MSARPEAVTQQAPGAGTTPPLVARHIRAIAGIERAAAQRASRADRISRAIAGFAGSMWFVLIHLVWFSSWMLWNRPGARRAFDPYPYGLLMLTVSLEAIFLATFVLISQNQMSRLADRRAHLDLQVDLLAESEMTKLLQLVGAIAARLDVTDGTDDPEAAELSRKTDILSLARDLDRWLDESKPFAR